MSRVNFFLAFFLLSVLVFALRLFQLQVLASDELSTYALQRSIRMEYLPSARGRLVDRNGVILAANRPSYDLAVVFARSSFVGFDINWYRRRLTRLYSEASDDFLQPEKRAEIRAQIKDMAARVRTLIAASDTLSDISLSTGVEPIVLVNSLSKSFNEVCRGWHYSWKPVVVARDIQRTSALDLVSFPRRFSGWEVVPSLKRVYPWDSDFFHVLGFMKKLSPEQTQILSDNGVIPNYIALNEVEYDYLLSTGSLLNDNVGKDGLERQFENVMRGESGMRRTLRISGKPDRVLQETLPKSGQDIQLSLDFRFQKIAMEELRAHGEKCSAVVMDPETGEILALASWPTLSPDKLSGTLSIDDAKELFNSPDAPLLNRTIAGEYPLGSIFKIVMAAAGLDEDKINENTVFDCEGSLTAGGHSYKCYQHNAHGRVNISDALKVSCNIFFYRLSELVEPYVLYTTARKFGVGVSSGIELPGEKSGNLPSAVEGTRWSLAERYQYAIGQGRLLVTPIQAARLTSAIANNGWLVRPTLLKTRFHPDRTKMELRESTIAKIREGLWRVVNERGGTANSWQAAIGVEWAGKTGSAEVGTGIETHSWFAGYVPAERPKYVVLVMCERAGSGGKVAAPIAATIIERIFSLDDIRKAAGLDQPHD